MGRLYDAIDARLAAFITSQPVFFVASAPLDADGHVNVSPKGYADTFAILDERTVAYLDLTGSGIETVAHLRENGRITLMFCAFEGDPSILRLYGRGRVLEPGDEGFDELRGRFGGRNGGERAIVVVDVERIADSCGYAVPFLRFEGERERLTVSHGRRGAEGLGKYQRERNGESVDGLPGLPAAEPDPARLPG